MARFLDQWKATLSTLTSIEFLALFVLGIIGPVQRDSPQWLLSAFVVVAGLIAPALLIGVVFVGVGMRALRRRRGDGQTDRPFRSARGADTISSSCGLSQPVCTAVVGSLSMPSAQGSRSGDRVATGQRRGRSRHI